MGKYNPNVSFDVPVVNLPTATPINKPETGTDVTISIPDISKTAQKAQEAALEKQYDAGLNDYARRVNEIAEGHRQGQYDVSTAEMYTRALDDEYLVQGYKASDLYKIRDKFDGGVRAIETERQKLMVKHEQERRLKYFDSFREEYGMPEATDEEIETITSNVEGLMRDVHKYQTYAGNKELSKEEQDRFKQAANISAERLSTVEAVMHMYGVVNDPQFHGQQLTPGLKSNVLNQMAKTLQSQGFGYRDAHIIANKVFRDGGFEYAFSEEFKTLKANDEYLKQAISVMKNTTLINVTSKSPTLKTMLAIGGGDEVLRQFAGSGEGLVMIQKAVGEVANANGQMSTVSLSDAGKATNIIFNNQYQPQTICDIAHTNMCNKAESDVIIPLDTLNDEDLKTDIHNIGQVIKILEDPKKLARLSEGVKARNKESLEVLRFAKAAAEGHQFAKGNNDFSRDVAALANSFQQNRLVVDADGLLRLTEGTEGFLQTAGNFFAYEGTRQQIERVNAALEKLTPAQRAGALMSASGGVIRGWDMEDEKLVNTANRLFSGYIKEGLATVASLAFGEQPKWFDDKEPQTFNQTSEQLQQQLDARMAADKVDVFTKNPKDPNAPVFNPPVTERTKELVNKSDNVRKVIEKSSAELMKDVDKLMKNRFGGTDSIQLRQQLGVKFKEFQDAMNEALKIADLKYQLEKTYQEEAELYKTFDNVDKKYDTQRAMYSAEELDRIESAPFTGEATTTTSKVSNKSTIGGASLVEDLQGTIAEVSNKHNIDPELMSLIVQRESANGKYTLSPKGARGYAQIMPKTWNEEVAPALGFTPEDIDDPVKNMEGGAWYMSKMMKVARRKFPKADEREIVDIAAAYYNWGQGNVGEAMQEYGDNWLKHAPKETKNYIQFLRDTYKREDEMMDGGPVGQDLNAWALLAALEDYIDYDRLPEDLKKKVKDPSTKAMREYYHQ